MRLLPLLTAALVCAALYIVVMERAWLVSILPERAEAAEAAPVEEPEAAPTVPQGTGAVAVVALRSQEQDVESGIVLRGRTEAARRLDVKAETTGQIVSQRLRKGQSVEEGDVLCRLDPATREATVAQARAALLEAQANETAAAQLAERGLAAENTAISRRAQLEAATSALEQAEREVERLTITAPFSGILENDTAELGQLMQPGTTCATILDLSEIRLVGFASERDIGRIRTGAMAGGRLISGEEVVGEVAFVGRSADPLTRTFRVEVSIPNPDGTLRDGSTAEILIALDGVRAHLLPQTALTLDDAGTLGVRLVVEDAARFAPVEVIRDGADGVWVAGLPAEADVIVVGQEFVSDGRAVTATYRTEGATQ
ncbi:efflux RND transporter periplasmic adaptor subunit [Roseobacter sp. HKCCA0434]|uniref:efflux RND transporter periplasmic adaptor subunit n=1 Tax=Roseobacter sp. HKCCA0434 TaxID=3079297 RepID=UPI002905DA99|nr:efflux RND transporter periplasmic adaptor subunit [Roseobacter sp. HKCCA0434]